MKTKTFNHACGLPQWYSTNDCLTRGIFVTSKHKCFLLEMLNSFNQLFQISAMYKANQKLFYHFDLMEHNRVKERRMQPARGRFARFDLDRQIASTFPAHWKVGPAPVFGASQPLEPAEWLALLILKAGDVESNPGPQNRKLPPSDLTTQTTTLNSTTHSHATTSHPNQKLLTLLQLNINSITNKHEELKLLVTELQPDIITIQETKLKKHNKTPQIPTYSAIRTDRANGKGGGLLTYIKHNITFSDTKIPNFINPINTELQIIQLHITNKKIYTIANIYIPP